MIAKNLNFRMFLRMNLISLQISNNNLFKYMNLNKIKIYLKNIYVSLVNIIKICTLEMI